MLYENSRTRRRSLSSRFPGNLPLRKKGTQKPEFTAFSRSRDPAQPGQSVAHLRVCGINKVFRKSHEISPCEIIIFYCDNVIQHIQWWVLTWHISRSDFLAQEQPCFIHRASRTACSGSPRHHARPCRFSARRPSSTLISDSRSTRKRARLAALRPRTAGTGRCTQRSASPRFVIFPAAVRPDAPCPDS